MPQWFPLDHAGRRVYYALAIAAAVGCVPRPESIAPAGLEPLGAPTAREWAEALRPSRPLRYDLQWRYTTQQGSSAGRAAIRFAPPDTVRFDYRGPFGKSGSALIVGDDVRWAQPQDDVASLIPAAPLFWAGLGMPLPPPEGAEILGRVWEGRRAWRSVLGNRAFDVIVRQGAPRELLAELREADVIVGRATTTYGMNGTYLAEARIAFPREAALLAFTVEAVDTLASFSPDTWSR